MFALAEPGDRAVEIGNEFLVALQVVLIVRDGLERRRALPAGEGRVECMIAEEMVHRPDPGQRQQVGLISAKRVRGRIFEHIIGELVSRIERGPVDGMERGKVMLGRRLLTGVIFVGDIIAEPVGVAHVAAKQGVERVALEAGLVAFLEQSEQLVVRRLLCDRRGRFHRSGCDLDGRRGRRAGGKHQCDGRCGESVVQLHVGRPLDRRARRARPKDGRRGAAVIPQRPFD